MTSIHEKERKCGAPAIGLRASGFGTLPLKAYVPKIMLLDETNPRHITIHMSKISGLEVSL